MNIKPLSIYIHWPFCKSKCPYCDFFKRIKKDIDQTSIIDSYIKELEYYHDLVPNRIVQSIFFGGGTPSLIKPENISRLIDHIHKLWKTESKIEISLEANPNSEYENMFKLIKNAGVNRLSLGVQALNDTDLKFLGRTHNLQQALHSIEEIIKNFDNHSMDLIYARPNQNLDIWQQELETTISFGFKHLSLYQLTIEEGTVFAAKGIKTLDEDVSAKMYSDTISFLENNGYPQYEVSNFAKTEYQSVHNKCYWLGDEYVGIGESAHGRLNINNNHYAITHPHDMEKITSEERAEELIIMGLRLNEGINKQHFEEICHINFDSFINQKAKSNLISQGLISENSHYLSATKDGFLVLNKIIEELCL